MAEALDFIECPHCDGEGTHKTAYGEMSSDERRRVADDRHYRGEEPMEDKMDCPFCGGTGQQAVYECEFCNGKGCEECDQKGWFTND